MGRFCSVPSFVFSVFIAVFIFGCTGQRPVAVVGGRVINRKVYWETLERYYGASTLQWLIQRELLLIANERRDGKAREKKLVTQKDVEVALKNIMRRMGFQNERQFKAFLARQGLDEIAFKEDIRFNLILHRLREERIQTDEKKLRKFYEENKHLFAQPPYARLYLLQAPDKEALIKAREQIKKGEDIRALAYRINKDPRLKSMRGYVEIPLIPDPHLVPPSLFKVLNEAPINQLVGPLYIKELKHWVLLKVIEKVPPLVPPFEDIKAVVRERYIDRFAPSPDEIFKELFARYAVTVRDPRYKFVEDLIRTAQFLRSSPLQFRPPSEPLPARPPSREGATLERQIGVPP